MPICFEIRVDDASPVVAGGESVSVLTAGATLVAARGDLEFRAGGMIRRGDDDNEFLEWLRRPLRVGQVVSIDVVESDQPSEPERRERADPDHDARAEREYYEMRKRKYEPEGSTS
jgi:hypothetical protein